MNIDYQKICLNLLEKLPTRVRNVVERRFGLNSETGKGEKETLENIGKSYGITRERVRQIEENGISIIKNSETLKVAFPAFDYFKEYLKKESGLKKEEVFLSDIGKGKFNSHVFFLLNLADGLFFRQGETTEIYPFWTTDKKIVSFVQETISQIMKFFYKKLRPVPKAEFLNEIKAEKDSRFISNTIEISKRIKENIFGEIGLVDWPEINPRGVKDKAYIVFKKEGRPLHFQEITEKINQLKFNLPKERPVLVQTVHNELIKDERFVLVGRGIYALSEWGYQPGQVRDIILKVLKETKKPLTKEEILKKVLSQRLVKENTVLLNLSNKNYFTRNSQGKYWIREA